MTRTHRRHVGPFEPDAEWHRFVLTVTETRACANCDGTGRLDATGRPCPMCHGQGVVEHPH